MEDLLMQLSEEENQKIRLSIVELLKPSYFPEEQVKIRKKRLSLLRTNFNFWLDE